MTEIQNSTRLSSSQAKQLVFDLIQFAIFNFQYFEPLTFKNLNNLQMKEVIHDYR